MLHTSFESASVPPLVEAEDRIMCLARVRRSPPTTRKDFRKRNETIRAAFAAGVSLAELAEHYGISDQRVSQIVNFRNH